VVLQAGTKPESLVVLLVRGADFVWGFDSVDGDWPAGAVIELVFSDPPQTRWPASVAGAAVDWNVDQAAVSALLDRFVDGVTPRAQLRYTHGATDLVWAAGTVSVVTT
jgi:hypothetical protein